MMVMGMDTKRMLRWLLSGFLALVVAGPAAAVIDLGGTDAQSFYDRTDEGDNSDLGLFTFDDTINGTNPSPEPGTVTTSDVPALLGGRINLEFALDFGSFDPATGSVTAASFIGTGPGAEVEIWDATQTTLLLSFDLDFINATGAAPFGGGTITLGNNQIDQLGVDSRMTVAGGTLAGAVGGIGTEAVLEVFISEPLPSLTFANLIGFWDDDFTVGIPANPPTSSVTWDISIVPEPSTALLLAAGLAGLAARRRTAAR